MINKKINILTIDTETCGLNDPVYDIGWQIHDRQGNVVSQYHALVKEIFTNGERMTRAHFAKKVFTDYAEMLDGQIIRLVPWHEIVETLRDHVKTYDATIVAAYNLGFDQRAIRLTSKLLGEGAIFQSPMKMLDLWQFACETFLSSAAFKKLARNMEWISPAGNIRTNAEVAYKFLTGELDFIESHTALSDAKIETEIAAKCYSMKKKIPYGIINASPWRIVNNV